MHDALHHRHQPAPISHCLSRWRQQTLTKGRSANGESFNQTKTNQSTPSGMQITYLSLITVCNSLTWSVTLKRRIFAENSRHTSSFSSMLSSMLTLNYRPAACKVFSYRFSLLVAVLPVSHLPLVSPSEPDADSRMCRWWPGEVVIFVPRTESKICIAFLNNFVSSLFKLILITADVHLWRCVDYTPLGFFIHGYHIYIYI